MLERDVMQVLGPDGFGAAVVTAMVVLGLVMDTVLAAIFGRLGSAARSKGEL